MLVLIFTSYFYSFYKKVLTDVLSPFYIVIFF
nr:MAG TPA: hypothetical protein [Caudoviricetes sp.]